MSATYVLDVLSLHRVSTCCIELVLVVSSKYSLYVEIRVIYSKYSLYVAVSMHEEVLVAYCKYSLYIVNTRFMCKY